MTRNYKPKNRPKHICSRGPYRPKRKHLEDLIRWDVRDYIDQAVPDVDDLAWAEMCEEIETIPDGWAEIDPRDPKYTIFVVEVEVIADHKVTLKLHRGRPFPNTPRNQNTRWWFWLCPICYRKSRFLYSAPWEKEVRCRRCWNRPYYSQSVSQAQRRGNSNRYSYGVGFYPGLFGSEYTYRGRRKICAKAPISPAGWVPDDLLRKFVLEKEDLQ